MTFMVIAVIPYVPLLGVLVAHILNWIGEQMLEFLKIVENLPYAVIENIYPFAYQIIRNYSGLLF
jgi:hypothetical protein